MNFGRGEADAAQKVARHVLVFYARKNQKSARSEFTPRLRGRHGATLVCSSNTSTTLVSKHYCQNEHMLRRRQLQHLQSRDSLQKPGSAASIAMVWMWLMHRCDKLPSHEVDASWQGQTVG